MADQAKIKIAVDGAPEAERKLKKVRDGFKDWGRELGGIVSGMVRNLGSMSASLATVDPGQAAQRFRDFRRTVTEASIASGRSIGELRQRFADLSGKALLPDEEVADFSASLAKATYDFGDSRKAIEALRGSGIAAGRSLEEMGGIAETLHNSLGASFEDIPGLLGRVEASAKSLGTTGGPAALIDDLQALGGVLSQVSVKGKRDASELVAILAAIGKGRTVEQAKQLQGALVGRFAAGGEQLRLNLGIKRQDFYDENGGIKVNAENVQRLRDFYLKRTGGNLERAQSLAAFSGNLGPQLASALFRPGLIEDIKKAEGAKPTGAGADALAKLAATDHGRETAAQIARERETRENVGAKANAAQQAVAGALPDNSITRYLVTGLGGGLASAVSQALITGAFGKAAEAAAKNLFAVGVAGDKAQIVLGRLAGPAAGVSVTGVAGAVAAGGAIALPALAAVATHDALIEPLDEGIKKSTGELKENLAAGKKRFVPSKYLGFLGVGSYEDVPAEKQAAAARDYAAKQVAAPVAVKPPPVEVKVEIVDASSHPNQVVQVQKGQAGQQ